MKVVFAGPSIHGATIDWTGIEPRPPAAQGDVFQAVAEGAACIGLIDGYFGRSASVWHKEILHALRLGVRVIGGASMGALRAAECASFGMEPVGRIAADYLSGKVDDDSLVALAHGPAELGFPPLTEALVDMLATFERLSDAHLVSTSELAALTSAARATFFEDRTLDEVLSRAVVPHPGAIRTLYRQNYDGVKQADALAVISRLRALPATRSRPPRWRMPEPPTWRAFVATTAARG